MPQEGQVAKTSIGNYTLGIFAIKKEDYRTLQECLEEISKNLSEFFKKGLEISVNGTIKKFKIRFLLSGDMKIIRASMGLNGSNSNFCCAWCKEEKINFHKNNLSDCNSKKRCLNDFEL